MGERVLLTGGSGFTGPFLAKSLRDRGHTVLLLQSPRHAANSAVAGLCADICDSDAMRRAVDVAMADVVIHLAGASQPSSPQLSGMLEANVLGAKNLLDALATATHLPRRVILASSSNVYGDQSVITLTESLCPKPVTVYGCSKLSMEYLARTYASRFEIIVARAFNYTGKGQADHFVVPKIVAHFRDRKSQIVMGKTGNARDFSDVRDVSEIYARFVDVEVGQRYECVNLTCGKVRTLREIIDVCAKLTGHEIDVVEDPSFMRANDPEVIRASTQHLEKMLGTIPARSLEDTLLWML